MTRSARKRVATFAILAPSNLSAARQEAVSAFKHARKKADTAYSAWVASFHSPVTSALHIASCVLVEEANWDACIALCNERNHYSYKCKPARQARLS